MKGKSWTQYVMKQYETHSKDACRDAVDYAECLGKSVDIVHNPHIFDRREKWETAQGDSIELAVYNPSTELPDGKEHLNPHPDEKRHVFQLDYNVRRVDETVCTPGSRAFGSVLDEDGRWHHRLTRK